MDSDLKKLRAVVEKIKTEILPHFDGEGDSVLQAHWSKDLARAENATIENASTIYADLTRYWIVQMGGAIQQRLLTKRGVEF